MRWLRELNRWWTTVFALDYRSMAAFRVGIGIVLLADVVLRWPLVPDMYTDEGMLPRDVMRQVWSAFDAVGLQQWGVGTWSLHALSGHAPWQYALLCLSAVFAAMLAAGAWTRVATVASFVLVVSIHNRIPFVLTSGDTHLRLVLFWTMFLPWGKIWSIDSWRSARHDRLPSSPTCVSAATAGLIVQMFILYFFSGLAKWNEIWWRGDGVFLALNLAIYNTMFSQSLLQYPNLCRLISVATVATEAFLPWLLFVPYKNHWWRFVNIFAFVGMHIGIVVVLSIGLFPYICIVAWIVMLPTVFWERFRVPLRLSSESVARVRPVDRLWTIPVNAFCAAMIPFMLIWNVINTHQEWVAKPIFDPVQPTIVRGFDECQNPIYRGYEIVGHVLGVGQHFQMFGRPPSEDAWFLYRAVLRNGQIRDVFLDGREIPAQGVLSGRDSMPHHHWRQLHRNLTDATCFFVRQTLTAFMAERWNKKHPPDEQIVELRLECYLDKFWPEPIPGEARGAVIWGTYPDGPENPFDALLNRALQGDPPQGF